jgi:Polysaccharide biosynthesis protein
VGKRQAAKAISLWWLGSLRGAGLAFLTQVILARRLGPSAFGVFASALATVTLLVPLAGFGMMHYSPEVVDEEGWGVMRGLPPLFHPTNGLLSDRFGQCSGIEPCAGEC